MPTKSTVSLEGIHLTCQTQTAERSYYVCWTLEESFFFFLFNQSLQTLSLITWITHKEEICDHCKQEQWLKQAKPVLCTHTITCTVFRRLEWAYCLTQQTNKKDVNKMCIIYTNLAWEMLDYAQLICNFVLFIFFSLISLKINCPDEWCICNLYIIM